MLLSTIIEKNIYVGENLRGICRGIGISLKTHLVKYLLCAATSNTPHFHADFSVNISAIQKISSSLHLKSTRALQAKNSAKIYIGLPMFLVDGTFLGNLIDVEMENFTAVKLYTNRGEIFPVSSIVACQDAVILRKEQPFPLGQRIPAPMLPTFFDKKSSTVTKRILKQAIQSGTLIKLTLSLSPFSLQEN